jgi:putative exosortase-associated protein (TIGR04073 family)
MKKVCLILATLAVAASTMADIQAPPGSRWNPVSKFSRGLANIVYGVTEIPSQWVRSNHQEGSSEGFAGGIIHGTHKSVIRVAWGLYDVVTFPRPTYKGGYLAPYRTKQAMNPLMGYSDYPPELGFNSGYRTTRFQRY